MMDDLKIMRSRKDGQRGILSGSPSYVFTLLGTAVHHGITTC